MGKTKRCTMDPLPDWIRQKRGNTFPRYCPLPIPMVYSIT